MIRGYSTFALALLLAACSGGGGTSTPSTPSAPNVPSTTAPAQATSGAPVATTFTFGRVTDLAVTRRSPNYVTTAVKSITIAVTAVNGNPPPSNVTPSVTSNVNITTCPCTVSGPGVPAGNDTFTLTAYDNANGTGNVISTASPTVAIVAAQANNNTIALNGVPASVMVTAPSGTAGTAATSPVSITVKDADAHAILGAYSAPITVSDADSSGATSISTSGSDNPAPGQILSSGDVASLAYTGLATSPVTLTASATGVATAIGLFAPALQPIVIAGTSTLNPSWAGVDFTAQTGGGSTGTMTATEVGWTNSPYNKTLQVTTDPSCSTIGTASITGTTITATASGSATAGSCPATVSNSIGQTATAVLAYTKFVFTGGSQSFALPANVTTVTISASGAQGGGSLTSIPGGKGATVTATLGSLSGTLTVLVGGGGGTGDVILSGLGPVNGGAGGFNGGGSGGSATSTNSSATTTGGGGGGGASSVSAGVTMLVVGGGGGGAPTCGTGSEQGSAGFPRGATGSSGGCASTAVAGIGGTQIVVGPGGAGSGGNAGADGSGGTGGAGGSATGAGSVNAGGGGGGGGFFGGGGGGGFVGSGTAEGGGGGSSFHATGATNVTAETAGTHGGDGVVTLTL